MQTRRQKRHQQKARRRERDMMWKFILNHRAEGFGEVCIRIRSIPLWKDEDWREPEERPYRWVSIAERKAWRKAVEGRRISRRVLAERVRKMNAMIGIGR